MENSIDIKDMSLYLIDISNKEYKETNIPEDSDFKAYVDELLSEIQNINEKRRFEFSSTTNEFHTVLINYFQEESLENKSAKNLAKRLLKKEIAADEKIAKLNKKVNQGCFLQLLLKENDSFSYCGVKVDYDEYLDRINFKDRIGLKKKKKIYRAVKVSFNKDGIPEDVHVFDKNTTLASYWWKEFLELNEQQGDELNTKRASEAVVNKIKSFKKDYPIDYNILKNTVIARFKQKGTMKYDTFVTEVFENYTPDDKTLEPKLQKIIKSLKELPDHKTKPFDRLFNLVPSAVKYKKSNVKLTREIEVSYPYEIKNLENQIWHEKSSNGDNLVVIRSTTNGFKQFKLKKREQL